MRILLFSIASFLLFFSKQSKLHGQTMDLAIADTSRHLYMVNGKEFNGNLTLINMDSVYLLFSEASKNKLLESYFPTVDGIVFVYSKNDDISSVSAEFFEEFTKGKTNGILYKIDGHAITDKKSDLKNVSLTKVKSITMIKNFMMKNLTTCRDDYYIMFLVNTGSIYQKGITDHFPRIRK